MLGKTISHYKVLEKLGEGGMGVVYKAQDTKLDRIVALKFLPHHLTSDPVEKERFVHEAKAASALNHPNVTTIYEIDEFEGQMFIVMEYCEGKTLKQIIEQETLPLRKVLDIGIQICEGLTIAHEKGIVHRDIKSANIMLTPRGQVKIMDFGLAKLKGAAKLTETRSTLGTAAYMSPEQAQGEEVDQRSDIFSFGVVLYELLTGRLPFEGEHLAAIIYSIISEEPQPVARFNNQVSAKLEDIVFKALAKDKDERYQHIDDLLADLRRERKSLEYIKTAQIPKDAVAPKPKKKLLPFIVPASIVFIIALVFLVLKPFKFEVVPEKGAIAKENSLAIMYFENLVDREDKERLGEIVTNLLITGLSESQYLNVVSSQRLYDILKLLGKEGAKVIDKNVASQVATKAGAKWMLLGSILQVEPRFVLTSQLVDVESGRVLGSQRITGEPKEEMFALVDKLITELKQGLSLPAQAQKEETPNVADVTTHSPEAYRYYLEGIDFMAKFDNAEAERSYRKAIEIDSTFAMAYYRLADLKRRQGEGLEQKKMIDKAVEYSDKVSQKERYYIEIMKASIAGDYAEAIKKLKLIVERYPDEKDAFSGMASIYYNLREFEEAVRWYNRVIEMDPRDKNVYNSLAYCYNDMGDFEKSIWAINKYISLVPDEHNPYDSRGDIYAWNGKIDQAIESYKKALEIKPDFYFSRAKLGLMYLFKKEYAQAESCFNALSASSDKANRSIGRTTLALIPLYQGKFGQALEILDNGIAADKMEQFEGAPNVTKHALKVFIYEERENLDSALKEAEICTELIKKEYPFDPVYLRDLYIYILAKNDHVKEAEEIAKSLKKDIGEKNQTAMYAYWLALGTVEQAKGNKKTAISCLEELTNNPLPNPEGFLTRSPLAWSLPPFQARFLFAEACLESNRLDEAVTQLEKALSSYDEGRATVPISAVKAYYLLGLAYEKSGWKAKAIEQYEEFLDIWKDADPGIKEVEDAKERLNKLRANS
jgi:serine/threonine protein kinase/Flp pilus assembly protein TadD